MKLFTYYLFTSTKCPYEIAKSWFEHFRRMNIAACITRYKRDGDYLYHVWVEYDPKLFRAELRGQGNFNKKLFGSPVESCGGFLERLNRKTSKLAPRTDYRQFGELEKLTELGGEEE